MSRTSEDNNARLWVVYVAMLVVGMGQTVIFAIMPMLGRELHLDQLVFSLPILGEWQPKELAITFLSAITALTFFIATPWWGRRSDWVGRKPVMFVGLIGYAVGMALFNGAAYLGLAGLAAGFLLYFLLIITRVLHSMIMSAMNPAAYAYIVDCTDIQNRTRGVSKLAASNQIGTMIGPALAWFTTVSFLAPFFLQAFLMFICGLLVLWLLPESPVHRNKAKSVTRLDRAGQKNLSYFDPRFRLYIGIGLVMYAMFGMVQQTLGFYFQDRLGLDGAMSAQRLSIAMVVSSAAMLFAQLFIVQRTAWPPHRLLVIGLPFCAIGYTVLALAYQQWSLLLGMGLFGFGTGLASPGYTTCATLTVEPHEQGALAGLTTAAAGLGFVFGPLTGGFIYRFDPSYPYWLAAIVIALLSLYVWRADPKQGSNEI